jgi:hypothetical protein
MTLPPGDHTYCTDAETPHNLFRLRVDMHDEQIGVMFKEDDAEWAVRILNGEPLPDEYAYRVGGKQARNIYRAGAGEQDQHIGCFFTEELGTWFATIAVERTCTTPSCAASS